MTNDNARLFDDLTRVAGGAASIFSAIGKQLQAGLQDQMGRSFSSSSSDEVARLQGTVTKLRLEQEELKKRIAELETMMGVKKQPAKKAASPSRKPVAKPAKKKAAGRK